MSFLVFSDRCSISLYGANKAISVIKAEFSDMLINSVCNLPIIGRIRSVDNISIPKSSTLLCDGCLYYDDSVFYIKSGGTIISCFVSTLDFEIQLCDNSDTFAAIGLLQAMINFYIPRYGLVFLHTASFSFNNKVYAIHAFGGTGKTEVMMKALFDGADFISDDLAIFDCDGNIYPYPRKIALHDYPFSNSELLFFGLNNRMYNIKEKLKDCKGRLSSRLYHRLRKKFNIKFHYSKITKRKTDLKFYHVDYHYWMETSSSSYVFSLSNDDFYRRMMFCMQNEFSTYINYDGYYGAVLPFWKSIREQYFNVLECVLTKMSVNGIKICNKNYSEVESLIIKK